MIDGLKGYPKYQESHVPWAGHIPLHWSIKRGKALFAESRLPVRDSDEIVTCFRDGQVTLRRNRRTTGFMIALKEVGYQGVRRGQLVIHAMDAFAGAIGISDSDGKCSPEYIVCNPRRPEWVPDYYARALRLAAHTNFIQVSCPAVRERAPRLRYPSFGEMLLPVPPPDEQAAIVRFLDHADRRIRRYIRAKQKLIKLLEEQKQAIIHRAVTRGLDPNVRLKPSGVEWLGEVPEHWEVVRFKQRVGFQEGPGIMAMDFHNDGVPLLRISCLRGDVATLDGCNYLDPTKVAKKWGHFAIQPGDYLLSASASMGKVVLATETVAGSIPYTGILRLWAKTVDTHMPFVQYYLGSQPFQDQIELAKSGVGIEHFGPTHLKRMIVAFPPFAEQVELAESVQKDIRGFAAAVEAARREIDFLREYRTRLIADVVTGKLDVRAAAAALPDEAEDAEPLDDLDQDADAADPDEDEDLDAGDNAVDSERASAYLQGLVRELCKLPRETEWVELKTDNKNPQEIGEYISALANAAALAGKDCGYLLWGVSDEDHTVVGTSFHPGTERKGNEELESWLLRLLRPRIDFRFHEVMVGDRRVVLLEIDRAMRHPVAFSGVEYIRVGTSKKKLKDFPEKERALWRIFEQVRFEDGVAPERVTDIEVLRKLDYPAYFELMQAPLPDGHVAILDALVRDRLIVPCKAGGFNVTNLGAVLFAKQLDDFPTLRRKAIRIIQYRGKDRTETVREQVGHKGYANGFEGLLGFINSLVPTNEVIGQALRRTVPMFPQPAVRELVANALIHQDFSVTGTGPMVELFDDRMEVTNPGEPLVAPERFLDSPPTSRNEALASLMRRIGICEERGSGIDKVVTQVELYQLPAPLFEVPPNFTRVVLFAHRPLAEMDKEDRVRACYLHACLKYVQRDYLTNASLRERFGIEEKNRAMASRLIRDAVEAGMIAAHDPDAAPKLMKYVPWWAARTWQVV